MVPGKLRLWLVSQAVEEIVKNIDSESKRETAAFTQFKAV
jgi:hypothetical protein